MNPNLICSYWHCRWHGPASEALTAPDPFNFDSEITACPKCREIGVLREACDEPDCKDEATCGTPTPTGYRRTCGKHTPKP